MRTTKYATELAHVAVPDGSDEARMELLQMQKSGDEEIRLSWWREGRMIPRPLDVPESSLVELIARAAREGVLSPGAVAQLRTVLAEPREAPPDLAASPSRGSALTRNAA